jgi:hypothetical protein
MAYLAPIHRPSSVRHALKLNLLNPEEECLVIAYDEAKESMHLMLMCKQESK